METPLTDAILSASRNEKSMLFRLSDLRAVTVSQVRTGPRRTRQLMPADTAPSREQVDLLDQLVTPLAPTPVLLPPSISIGSASRQQSYFVPLVLGLGIPLFVGVIVVALVVHIQQRTPTPSQDVIASTAGSAASARPLAALTSTTSVPSKTMATKRVAATRAEQPRAEQPRAEQPRAAQPGSKQREAEQREAQAVRPEQRASKQKQASKQKRISKQKRFKRHRRLTRRAKARRRPARRSRAAAWAARSPRKNTRKRAVSRRASGGDDIDSLLASATTSHRQVKQRAGRRVAMAPRAATAQRLSAPQIKDVMRGIKPQVMSCSTRHGAKGLARVQVVIATSGRVKSAKVLGELSRSPGGTCIAKAARGARFPSFSGKPVTIIYPFVLR